MSNTRFQLHTYVYLDRMQPQFAACIGTITQGDLLIAGMAALCVEMAPGNIAERATSINPIHTTSPRQGDLVGCTFRVPRWT